MNLNQFKKVFTLYLKSDSYSEIEKSTGIPKSTVQRWIQEFKDGDIGMYKDTLPYIDELTEVAKFMRENGLELADIKSAAVIASIIKSIGIQMDTLIEIGKSLKSVNAPEVVSEVAWTIVNLIGNGTKPSELQQKIDEMQKEKSEKVADLAMIDKNIEDKTEAERKAEEKLSKKSEDLLTLQKNLAEAKKELESVRGETEQKREIIENAEEVNGFTQKNDIDLNQLNQFYSMARKYNFDIERISSIIGLESFGLSIDTETYEISDIVKSLDSLYKKGWNYRVLKQLDLVTENTNIQPGDAVDDLLRYYKERDFMKNSLDSLKREEEELAKSIESKTSEYGKLKKEYDHIVEEKDNAQKQKDSLETDISNLKTDERLVRNGIISIEQIDSLIDTKRSQVKDIQNEIQKYEILKEGMEREIEDERNKIESAQQFFELMKFGTPGTVRDLKNEIEGALDKEDGNFNINNVTDRNRSAREAAMKLLFEIAGDGVAGINYHNLGKLRIIDGEEYEDLISYRNRLNEINHKDDEIKSEMNEMSKDISTFISDVIEEKIKATQEVDRLIVRVTEREIRKQLKTELEAAESYQSVMSKISHDFNLPTILLQGSDRDTKRPVAGFVYPADFAEALKSGDYVKIMNGTGGSNYIHLCTAMRQVFLTRFNYNFYKSVQETFRPAKITAIRRDTNHIASNKEDEKPEQQFTRAKTGMHGGILHKDEKKNEEKREGN